MDIEHVYSIQKELLSIKDSKKCLQAFDEKTIIVSYLSAVWIPIWAARSEGWGWGAVAVATVPKGHTQDAQYNHL